MIDKTETAPHPIREVRFASMAIASFLLYALGVLALHQDRAPGWNIEAQGPIPSAVSHLVYGTRLGAMDENVMRAFLQPNGTIIQDVQGALAKSAEGSIPRGPVYPYTFDGNGAGSNLFATIAMWMFGISISSLVLFYLSMIGVSTLAFVWRYQGKRLFVVPLYFLVATVMLLTPLCTSGLGIDQNPIGGNRFFVLATFLPAIHIYFEIIDRSDASGTHRISNSLALFVQGILLFGALLVRSSTGYVLGVLLGVLIWRIWRDRTKRAKLIELVLKTAIVGAAFAFWIVFVAAALPAYVKSGRVLGNFWHRAFISFSLDPAWPFGDLRKVYDCTRYLPEGLNRTAADRNGQCVWWTYPPNASRSMGEVNLGLYGGEYERALRNAYFYVLVHYPRQAFETYFYIKSHMLKDVLTAAWAFLFELPQAPVAEGLFVIVVAQLILFLAFAVSIAVTDLNTMDGRLIIFPILFFFSLAPLYVAWASSTTTNDTIFLMYSCLFLIVLFLVQSLNKIVACGALRQPTVFLKSACTRWLGWRLRRAR